VPDSIFPAENGMTEFDGCVANTLPVVGFRVTPPALLVSDKDEKESVRLPYLAPSLCCCETARDPIRKTTPTS